jgi:hypothetical protein
MYEKSFGEKYDSKLNTTQIAARFREDVKAAVKSGALPKGLKLSVRSSYYSGGSSIDVAIKEAPVTVLAEPRLFDECAEPNKHSNEHMMTLEAEVLQAKIERMLQAYNFDGSDIQTDYFNVNFYGHVRYASELERGERDAYAARYKAGGVQKPAWDGKQTYERRTEVQMAVYGKCPQCEGVNTPGHKDAMHPDPTPEPEAPKALPAPEPEKAFGGYPECPKCGGNESPVIFTMVLGSECQACRMYRQTHHADPANRLNVKPALRVVEAVKEEPEAQVAFLESLGVC